MRKILLYSVLLLLGFIGSQWLPVYIEAVYAQIGDAVRVLTMVALSFIMIRVGYEFNIDKSNLRQYGWDYFVAFTAASLPWIFVTLYFLFIMLPPETWWTLAAWQEMLLAGRFAAPTSAGILFSMLAAAGLSASWLFRKARILAIFDDLDTVLLMIPLKMLMVGLAWQLGVIVVVMVAMLVIAYKFLHKVRIPISWQWVLAYSVGITAFSEVIYTWSKVIDETIPIHIEVLLPAFVLGCIIAYPKSGSGDTADVDSEHKAHELINTPRERMVTTVIAAVFMVLVGLSMPKIPNLLPATAVQASPLPQDVTWHGAGSPAAEKKAEESAVAKNIGRISAAQPPISLSQIAIHVLIITIISNLGKMVPAFSYRKEAHWRERLSLAIGMWPRGEVGAGVLVISLSYGIGGPVVTVAMLSLALNLLLAGLFIYFVKRLTMVLPAYQQASE